MKAFRCPLCGGPVVAEVLDGSIHMYDLNEENHVCGFSQIEFCCKCQEEKGLHAEHYSPHWLCPAHGGPKYSKEIL